ncbi:hypothetical protein [Arthrobacter castelli]|uniref:hypothetical protein n=1 Tax=Arthrobacter castelli TaxID=271431 RepID=UPI00041ED2BD|nr:hypothetical protein [Arthrobacter castelli]
MTQQPHITEHPGQTVAGSAALAPTPAGTHAPDHGGHPERRTPLSVVPAGTRRRRVPFAVFCFVALVASLVGVLVLNVSVSSGQYQLVELNSKQASLQQKNEMLTQRVKNHVAPQNLASQAAELGMVSSPTFGTIDLNSMRIAGEPEPAEKSDGPDARVPAPDVSIIDQAPTASGPSSEKPDSKPSGSSEGSDSTSQDNGPDQGASDSGQSEADGNQSSNPQASGGSSSDDSSNSGSDDGVVPAPVQRQPADLNGGTIPAPQQAGQE